MHIHKHTLQHPTTTALRLQLIVGGGGRSSQTSCSSSSDLGISILKRLLEVQLGGSDAVSGKQLQRSLTVLVHSSWVRAILQQQFHVLLLLKQTSKVQRSVASRALIVQNNESIEILFRNVPLAGWLHWDRLPFSAEHLEYWDLPFQLHRTKQ